MISFNPRAPESGVVSWADFYQIIALVGGVAGIWISKSWGGIKSLLGRAILIISIGLFLQNIGQTIFSIYDIFFPGFNVYPSLADVGFFGSIPFYIYGAYLLCKVCGVHKSFFSKLSTKLLVVGIPVIILMLSYFVFLKDYVFDFSSPLKIFLDFGYPLGQALYIALALVAFFVSKDALGGIMRGAILVLVFAFFVQYLADFNFLYQSTSNSWVLSGSYGDFLYLIAYTVMSYALIKFGYANQKMLSNKE